MNLALKSRSPRSRNNLMSPRIQRDWVFSGSTRRSRADENVCGDWTWTFVGNEIDRLLRRDARSCVPSSRVAGSSVGSVSFPEESPRGRNRVTIQPAIFARFILPRRDIFPTRRCPRDVLRVHGAVIFQLQRNLYRQDAQDERRGILYPAAAAVAAEVIGYRNLVTLCWLEGSYKMSRRVSKRD